MGGLSGCHHRTVVAPLPSVQTPVPLVGVPPATEGPVLEVPQVKLPPVPIAAAAAKPKREKKRPAKTVVTAPNVPEPAPAAPVTSPAKAPAEENPVGALTAGGESNPQNMQEAADLIASIEKRLNGLPTPGNDNTKAQANQVRNFWRDAKAALKSGDAEGAMTLATKAKLLLDDLDGEK